MRSYFFMLILIVSNSLFAQKDEIVFDEEQRNRMHYFSSSAFMQYSNFQPSNIEELLISVSGDNRLDSILIQCDLDTIVDHGAKFFDAAIRKDFGLTTIYSPTTKYFVQIGLYSEKIMKCFILQTYFHFLRKEPISINKIPIKTVEWAGSFTGFFLRVVVA